MCFVAAALAREIAIVMLPLTWHMSWYLSPIHKQYSRLNTFFFSLTLCTFLSFFLVCAQVARRLDLVYGGGSIGLMGLVSKAVHHGGGNVIG